MEIFQGQVQKKTQNYIWNGNLFIRYDFDFFVELFKDFSWKDWEYIKCSQTTYLWILSTLCQTYKCERMKVMKWLVFWFVTLHRFGLLGEWFLCMGYTPLANVKNYFSSNVLKRFEKYKNCKIIVLVHFLFCQACEISFKFLILKGRFRTLNEHYFEFKSFHNSNYLWFYVVCEINCVFCYSNCMTDFKTNLILEWICNTVQFVKMVSQSEIKSWLLWRKCLCTQHVSIAMNGCFQDQPNILKPKKSIPQLGIIQQKSLRTFLEVKQKL